MRDRVEPTRYAMDDPQRPPTPPDRASDDEPLARWENEGGAYDTLDAPAPPALPPREMVSRRTAYEAPGP
jgi:hypothetical protein